MNQDKKPNFLIVGAPKAGTTSIYQYLNQHPEIYFSKEKEPFYFLPNILNNTNINDPMYQSLKNKSHLKTDDYLSLFNDVKTEKAIGEATVHYLYHYKEVIPNIKRELNNPSIIIILRNPIHRAFSNYKYQSRGQFNSFEKALELEEYRIKNNFNSFWYYKKVGLYFDPVKSYINNFDKVHVCFFEDFIKNKEKFMTEVFSFLCVDSSFKVNLSTHHNKTIVPKNKLLHLLYFIKHRLKISFNLSNKYKEKLISFFFKENKDKISKKTYNELVGFFKYDIIKLERLLKKDLSDWYKKI